MRLPVESEHGQAYLPMPPKMDLILIIFVFILGACIGSFLNVVVWRLPRGQSLVRPGSHCPKCEHPLAWYDNLPVIGWILLGGRCRYCKQAISPRYPIIEAITGLLFAGYYVAFYVLHLGPCAPVALVDPFTRTPIQYITPETILTDWPIYAIYMLLIGGLLAASLVDIEMQIIPAAIPWTIVALAVVGHALADRPNLAGSLNLVNESGQPLGAAAWAAGGAVGLMASIAFLLVGWFPRSFPDGEPELEIDRDDFEKEVAKAKHEGREPPTEPKTFTSGQIRREVLKEAIFLLPPLLLGGLWWYLTIHVSPVKATWAVAMREDWFTGLLGALLGGMVGGLVVWSVRILGTLGFGRVAMGLGDVDLMCAIGAVMGAELAVVTFFIAPFMGLLVGIYMLIARRRHELPYGPYLSLAAAAVMLFGCSIHAHFRPQFAPLGQMIHQLFAGQ